MSLGSLRLTALVLCNWGGLWPISWGFITHPLSLPENCLCCGDFLSVFLVSDSPWLLKIRGPVLLTHVEALMPLIKPRAAAWKALGVESPGLVPQLALRVPADFSQQGLLIASLSGLQFRWFAFLMLNRRKDMFWG